MKVTKEIFFKLYPNASDKHYKRYLKKDYELTDLKCFSEDCTNIRELSLTVTRGFKFFCCKNCEIKNIDLKRQKTGEIIKQSNLKKYGVTSTSKLPNIKQKSKETCLEKYGCVSPGGNSIIKQKTIETNLKKYGCSNPMQNTEIKNKFIDIIRSKYGRFKSQLHLQNFEFFNNKQFWENNFIIDGKFDLYKCQEFFNCGQVIAHQKLKELEIKYIKHSSVSLKEQALYPILNDLDLIYETNDRLQIGLELDIYLPELNLAIEYNGTYWHSYHETVGTSPKQTDYEYMKYRHQQKSLACYKAGIRLLHIYEYETEDEILNKLENFLLYEPKLDTNTEWDLDSGCYRLGLEYQVLVPEQKIVLNDRLLWNAGKIILRRRNGGN